MNIRSWINNNKWHFLAIPLFIAIAMLYFLPFFQGKNLDQFDKKQWRGSAEEIIQKREKGETDALWTNSMFCGMPSYQIFAPEGNNLISRIFRNGILYILPTEVSIPILAMCSFYLLGCVLGISPFIGIIFAFAFAFSTYNIGALEAGQITKIAVVAAFPLTLAGVLLLFKNRYLWGFIISAFGVAMSFSYNHLQMTYYLLIAVMVFFIVNFIFAIKEGQIPALIKQGLLFGIAVALAALTDITNLWTTAEYSSDTIRGPAILASNDQSSGGLDKDYALAWSSGKFESFTFLIPNIVGGSSFYKLPDDAASVKYLMKQGVPKNQLGKMPTYWGEMPATGCPYYSGIIVAFLFLMASFLVRGPIKWAWLAVAALSLMLSWGKHFDGLTSLFFLFFPAYNKFRAVSTILVLFMTMLPLAAAIGLQKIVENKDKEAVWKAFKYSAIALGSVLLFFLLLGSSILPFSSGSDAELDSYGYDLASLIVDRKSLFKTDAIRSFLFFLAAAGVIYYYTRKQANTKLLLGALGILIIVDLWTVDKRHFNNNAFKSKASIDAWMKPTEIDKLILADPDPHYRVYNLSIAPFNDAQTSFFHKSLGGYHGAKLRRYQDIIDKYLIKNNLNVISLLNAKYLIIPDKSGAARPQKNPEAAGNCWFPDSLQLVATPDEEIDSLENIRPKNIVYVDKKYEPYLTGLAWGKDSLSTINQTAYDLNIMKYEVDVQADRLAVFSEIYYNEDKGWQAYIDDKPTEHIRVNYLLRGLKIPAGKHKIEFRMEPKSYYTAKKIGLASSGLLILLLLGGLIYPLLYPNKKEENKTPIF